MNFNFLFFRIFRKCNLLKWSIYNIYIDWADSGLTTPRPLKKRTGEEPRFDWIW
jgi:hypothetical protein